MSGIDGRALADELAGVRWIDLLVVLDAVDSTNDDVRRRQAAGARGTVVVLADRQTAGRGRRGREWHSPPGLGLYASVALAMTAPAAEAPRWTLAASVAACEACRALCDADIRIDWPNDLVCGPGKLGGILTELRTVAGRGDLLVGTGINVHHDPGDLELDRPATSLRIVTGGREPTRERLAGEYLRRLYGVVAALRDGRWPEVAGRWRALSQGAFGRRVRVRAAGVASRQGGITDGIAADGALRVRLADGSVREVRLADAVETDGEE